MDNLTHSLFGTLTAELYFHGVANRKPVSRGFRKALWLASVFANNFPDLDFLYARSIGPRNLSYLMHHRGHTHTLVAAIPSGLIVALVILGIAKFFKWDLGKREKVDVIFLSFLGIITHIALDFLNAYGVHPLWPFDNRWYYGDTLFIIEPWVWMILLIPMYFVSSWKSIQYGAISVFLIVLGLIFFSGRVIPKASIPVVLFCVPYFFFLRKTRLRHRPLVSLAGFCLVVAVFAHQGFRVRENFKGTARDIILSPMPANPWCWRVITMELPPETPTYQLRRAMVSSWPGWMSLEQCLESLGVVWPIRDVTRLVGTELVWMGGVERPLKELRDYHRSYCDIQGYMKVSRAPYLWNEDGKMLISDMRFDLVKVKGFSVLEAGKVQSPNCQPFPPWVEPRRDLLE